MAEDVINEPTKTAVDTASQQGDIVPRFNLRSVIEQTPIMDRPVQNFLGEWFTNNDSISPQFIDRQSWEKKAATDILEKMPKGGKMLFMPDDLRLWEMVGVFERIDQDTFADKNGRGSEASEKVRELMSFLRDTGVYFYSHLDRIQSINQAVYESRVSDTDAQREEKLADAERKATVTQDIARAMAEELYEYGRKFGDGSDPELAEARLSPQRILCLDIYVTTGEILSDTEGAEFLSFLSNPDTLQNEEKAQRFRAIRMMLPERNILVYASQKGVFDSKANEIEDYRSDKIAQFFRVSEQAFELKQRGARGELEQPESTLKPWQDDTPIYQTFLNNVEHALTQDIEAPKQELVSAVFRRGMKKLVDEMREPGEVSGWKGAVNELFKKAGIDLQFQQKKLADSLHISRLKADLESLRLSGNSAEIAAKEREIADSIQEAVSKFPYMKDISNPTDMVLNRYRNCVGASMLGGALMEEAGLHYLVGQVPEHSILVLVTDDGHVELRDMQTRKFNQDLTDDVIHGVKQDGSQLTINDIVDFSHRPSPQGLLFDTTSDIYRDIVPGFNEGQRQYISIFEPELGQQLLVLNSTGVELNKSGQNEEALEAFHQAIAIEPQYASPYHNLGIALRALGRNEEALEAFHKAIAINPQDAYLYNGLGVTLENLERNEEALEAYHQAIAINPQDAYLYSGLGNALLTLGQNEEALEPYHQAIAIDPQDAHPHQGLGIALRILGRNEESLEAFHKAIAINPQNAYPYQGLGVTLENLGRNEEAVIAYTNFLKFADTTKDSQWIHHTQKKIALLQSRG